LSPHPSFHFSHRAVRCGSLSLPKSSPQLWRKRHSYTSDILCGTRHIHDVDAYLATVDAGDPKKEIAYEILKTAGLREIKRRRFLRALWAAAMGFVVLFLGQVLRAEGLLPI
jgi:hypothetical protein